MTFGRWLTFAVCLVAAMAIGIWISPYIRGYQWATAVQTVGEPAQSAETPQSAKQTAQSRPAVSTHSARPRAADTTAKATNISLSAPELHAQLKPLLNKGANMNVAAQDFRDAEQFAAVAHAARNTEIPFMVLKHRVVNERKPLATAIRELKPDVDAAAQAKRAQAEARSDIAALAS
jgi:hypothetical protein